jgi:hypothetical protein
VATEKKSKGKSWLNYPYPNAIITSLLGGLKIGGVIGWNWWVVASLMWIPLAVTIGVCILAGALIGLGVSIIFIIRQIREAM